MSEIISPYTVVKVNFQRRYPGYTYRRELIDMSELGDSEPMEMVVCYAEESGHYMGNAKMARYLCKKRGIRHIQKAMNTHSVASIGLHVAEGKWYGWSHRAICGFGIGDKIFQENFGNDETLYTEHGRVTIKQLNQAKLGAIKFAASVS